MKSGANVEIEHVLLQNISECWTDHSDRSILTSTWHGGIILGKFQKEQKILTQILSFKLYRSLTLTRQHFKIMNDWDHETSLAFIYSSSWFTWLALSLTTNLLLVTKKYLCRLSFNPTWHKGCLQKKIAQKETLVHSHFSPSLPNLNGTRGIGTQTRLKVLKVAKKVS